MATVDPASIATLRGLGECWAFCTCGHRGTFDLNAFARRHGWAVRIGQMQRTLRCGFCLNCNPAWIVIRLKRRDPPSPRSGKRPHRDSDEAMLEWKRYEALLALGPPDLGELRRRAMAQIDYFAMLEGRGGFTREAEANARAIVAFCDSLAPAGAEPAKPGLRPWEHQGKLPPARGGS